MPLVRRALTMVSAALLAGATLVGSAGTATAAEEIPESPYCFTVDGTGVCVVLDLSVTHSPDVNNGDATAALTAEVDYYCTGGLACADTIYLSPVTVGRTGVVAGDPRVENRWITDLRVPEVCVPGGCFGPYVVPVYAPMVTGSVATLWLLGQDTSEACWLAACP